VPRCELGCSNASTLLQDSSVDPCSLLPPGVKFNGRMDGVHLEPRMYRVQVSGFRIQGSGLRVQGPGFRVQVPGSRVQGSGLRVEYQRRRPRWSPQERPPHPRGCRQTAASLRWARCTPSKPCWRSHTAPAPFVSIN